MKESNKLDLNDKLIAFKSLVGIIGAPVMTAVTGDPFLATGATNLFLETFFNIQSEVKMKRVNLFFNKLEKGIQEIESDFDLNKVDKVDLRDLIETAMLKSTRANSERKIERLKKIIIGQIKYAEKYDYVSRYLDLVEKLTDNQIVILVKYVKTEKEFIKIQSETSDAYKQKKEAEKSYSLIQSKTLGKGVVHGKPSSTKLNQAKQHVESIDGKILEAQNAYNRIRRERNEQSKILGENEFNFLLNDLRVLGLIYNPSEGRASDTGEYSGYRCTVLALGLIKFLR